MRKIIQKLANRSGYRIEKIRTPLPGNSIFILDFILNVLNERRQGEVSFIQLGANDGVREDPCYAWINSQPWRGVLVEPQPDLAARLRELHQANSRVAIEEAIISPEPDTRTLYVVRDVPELNGIASTDRDLMIREHGWKMPDFEQRLTAVEVPSMSLAQLAEKHGILQPDFLQIDIEGLDYEVIRTIDFAKMKPTVLSYEHCNLSPEDQRSCRALLTSHGYEFASSLGDTFAIQDDLNLVSADRSVFLR